MIWGTIQNKVDGEVDNIFNRYTVDEGVEKDTWLISFKDASIFFEDDEDSDILWRKKKICSKRRRKEQMKIRIFLEKDKEIKMKKMIDEKFL